jgi:hypothetical protein
MGGICLTHGILASLFTARVNSISEYASHIGMLIPLNVGASCILSTILFNNMATAHHASRDIHILFIWYRIKGSVSLSNCLDQEFQPLYKRSRGLGSERDQTKFRVRMRHKSIIGPVDHLGPIRTTRTVVV